MAHALALGLLLPSCTYYNSIYNAERRYLDGERHRRVGQDSLAAAAYGDVVRKASEGYRRDPTGEWADDALLLVGKARLRLGELRAADAALERAGELARDEPTRLASVAYRGSGLVESGRRGEAAPLLDEALRGLRSGDALAEAHLQRARSLFMAGDRNRGWWDLDRAVDFDEGRSVEAALERLRWAVHLGDRVRSREAVDHLLTDPDAAARMDSIVTLARSGTERWGARGAAEVLAGAESARWGRTARGRIRLERARLLREAGEPDSALAVARSVAEGFGVASADARVLIARWDLEGARDLAQVDVVTRLLRPLSAYRPAADLLAELDELARMTTLGLDEPLGLFVAAEIARDRLDAPILARGLYLAYADEAPSDPWTAKALLAALVVSPAEGDRAWIRGRLEARVGSPYLRASRGHHAPGLEQLEEELARRVESMRAR